MFRGSRMRLSWPDLTFPPINLWSMPCLTYIEFRETREGSKVRYTTIVKDNPLYKMRSR